VDDAAEAGGRGEVEVRPPATELLRRLGEGESIASVAAAVRFSAEQFSAWWQAETRSRVPSLVGTQLARVQRAVHVDRDAHGIPHIHAENDEDLFFAFGFAMAQDRLFQLDYLRRRGSGRLCEILGPDAKELDLMARVVGFESVLELDLLARTVGIRRIAEAEWARLPEETRTLLEAFSRGINLLIEQSRDNLPVEFDLLDYRPEPWSPVDCLTIEVEFRWYLTGRFPVIVIPELVKRSLGDGSLYRAFLRVEDDDESILPPGSYSRSPAGVQPAGGVSADPQAAQGSNNWVLAGSRTQSGKPLLASDPHIAFDAVSCWYEVHLSGGSFNVVGTTYTGMPAVLFGRNERVAWGCTNNICSQRDLYQEKTDPAHPGCFLYDGQWEPQREREEVIAVKGGEPVRKTIRFSRNGPIVDDVLPPLARHIGPVSLRWLGAEHGGWLTALLGMNRARSADEFREALRPWHVPTFSVVFADVEGHIGYQAMGRIPIRKIAERGYRPGWDPDHQWQGLIPFEGMPRLADPQRGWIATANNRPAPDDYPYPLSGTWSDGQRARRIRQMIESASRLSHEDCAAMQQDALSLRGVRCRPALLDVLTRHPTIMARDRSQQKARYDPEILEAAAHIRAWDGRMEPGSVGATIFEVFFTHWCRMVVQARMNGAMEEFLASGVGGLAAALLIKDAVGWFIPKERELRIITAFLSALLWLTRRLGPDMDQWQWRKLHVLTLHHILSGRGDLGRLLDRGGLSVRGSTHTVCNTASDVNFEVRTGPNYRLIADMNESPAGLWAVDSQGQSGHPGSTHYGEGLREWIAGRYHFLALDCKQPGGGMRLTLEPDAPS
jgi:penicillin amidase